MTIFVGIDWAEAHHDVCVLDAEGRVLATRRIAEGLEGVALLHALLAEHVDRPAEVVVGIETDRGLLVTALVDRDYQREFFGEVRSELRQVFAVRAVYRDRLGQDEAAPGQPR